MKTLTLIAGIVLAASLMLRADGTNSVAPVKPKPDLLKTCPVSGDKLGGDMGEPYVFTYKGQEVKLCCPNCKADFDKDPAKYMKIIRAADKTEKKTGSNG
jgi:YHS domain-containing protein